MPMQRKVTPEVLERMRRLKKKGLTYREIAEKVGLPLSTVASHMKKEGLGGRRRKVTPGIVKEMRRLRGEGLSHGEIAGRLGLSQMTVYNYLRKEGRPGLIERLKRRLGLK